MAPALSKARVSAAMQPIRITSIANEVVDVLQRAILSGEYRPGQRLYERELSARFGVSSIPIREALRELEGRGLVSARHNYGCSVISLSAQELLEIVKLRKVLEPKVVEWAAKKMTPAAASEIERQLARLTAAADAGDVSGFFYEDLLFHRAIWDQSGNRYAVRALHSAVGSLFASGMIPLQQSGTLNMLAEARKHTALFEALCKKDGRGAAKVLMEIAQSFETHVREEAEREPEDA